MSTSFIQQDFFDAKLYKRLDERDRLFKMNKTVDWSGLEVILKREIRFKNDTLFAAGRKPKDRLMMAKGLLLQSWYSLSDDELEFQINDRLTFKRFLGLCVDEKAPDAKTFWVFRERIKDLGLEKKMFDWFFSELSRYDIEMENGKIVDASFTTSHKSRHPNEERKKAKNAKNEAEKDENNEVSTDEHASQIAPQAQLQTEKERNIDRQIDKDSTFTKKGNLPYHGYKTHILADSKTKIIQNEVTTTASVHDSQALENLIEDYEKKIGFAPNELTLYADSGYAGGPIANFLESKKIEAQICEKGYRAHPLTQEQKESNRIKSKPRARVEHIFGTMETSMHGMVLHTIGLARAKVKNTLKCLAYNLLRLTFLVKEKILSGQESCV